MQEMRAGIQFLTVGTFHQPMLQLHCMRDTQLCIAYNTLLWLNPLKVYSAGSCQPADS